MNIKNYHIISIVFFLALQGCSESTEPVEIQPKLPFTIIAKADDSELSDSIKVLYLQDAATITIRAVIEDSSELLYDVSLPLDYMINIYNGLIHIHNSRDPEDTLTYNYQHHSYFVEAVEVQQIYIHVDSTVNWVKSMLKGEIETDNDSINSLVNEYFLSINSHFIAASSGKLYIILESTSYLNTYALSKKFDVIEGVISTLNIRYASSATLFTVDTGLNWEFNYRYGWGPCGLSGDIVKCKYEHNWLVQVDQAGEVSLLESTGDDIHGDFTKKSLSTEIVQTNKIVLLN